MTTAATVGSAPLPVTIVSCAPSPPEVWVAAFRHATWNTSYTFEHLDTQSQGITMPPMSPTWTLAPDRAAELKKGVALRAKGRPGAAPATTTSASCSREWTAASHDPQGCEPLMISPPTATPALPCHDELGFATRALEAASLAAAAGLLAFHVLRFAQRREALGWWLPLAVAGAALAADFVSGLVHWFADTWGSESMPLLGRRFVRPFRVHHVNPDDLLRRSFVDCNGDVAMLTIPVLACAASIPLATDWQGLGAVFLVTFCAATLPTNQIHQWAHMTEPPRWVARLQRWGVILSCQEHLGHHTAPFATNYCIASGWCNRALAAIDFFPRLERLVSRTTGLRPREDAEAPSDVPARPGA